MDTHDRCYPTFHEIDVVECDQRCGLKKFFISKRRSRLADLRVAFCFMVILGLAFTYLSWKSQRRIENLLQNGLGIDATVTKARITHGRGSTYWVFDLEWHDSSGMEQHMADFNVSPGFYREKTAKGQRPPFIVRLKYLADYPARRWRIVLVDDQQENAPQTRPVLMWLGFALFGFLGVTFLAIPAVAKSLA
jgi:hypothetical protein